MELNSIKKLELPDLNPGDTIYYEIIPGFIVPVAIIEIEISFNINDKSYWFNKTSNKEYISCNDENFQFKVITNSDEIKVLTSEITSQGYIFYWIDEFVGNSLEMGCEIYKTLNQAFANSCKINKRLAKRRHKKVEKKRRQQFNWLKFNNKWNRELLEEKKQKLVNLNKKPIYVRK